MECCHGNVAIKTVFRADIQRSSAQTPRTLQGACLHQLSVDVDVDGTSVVYIQNDGYPGLKWNVWNRRNDGVSAISQGYINALLSFPKLTRRLGVFCDASDSEEIIDFSPEVDSQSVT